MRLNRNPIHLDDGCLGPTNLDDVAVAAESASQIPAWHLQRPLAHQIRDCSAEQDGPSSRTGVMLFLLNGYWRRRRRNRNRPNTYLLRYSGQCAIFQSIFESLDRELNRLPHLH